MTDSAQMLDLASTVLAIEADAIKALTSRLDKNFTKACQIMLERKGRVIVVGMGKSGHIGNKIAATLASTGTPAFFVHPAEACHGDMGMITEEDTLLALSYSGSNTEILTLVPRLKRLDVPIIALTGEMTSPLAEAATVVLDIHVEQEACPLGLAPRSSPTATLAMGDALAIALLDARGFTADDFARSHPGGRLGRRLLLTADDVMHREDNLPVVNQNTHLADTLVTMTTHKLGIAIIVNDDGKLEGVFTDGDLRRALEQQTDLNEPIHRIMTRSPQTCHANDLAVDVLNQMQQFKITCLIVESDNPQPVGAVHIHDILQAGVV